MDFKGKVILSSALRSQNFFMVAVLGRNVSSFLLTSLFIHWTWWEITIQFCHFQLCSIFYSLPTSPNPSNLSLSLHCSELLNHFFLHNLIPCFALLLFQLLLLCIPSYQVFPSQTLHLYFFPLFSLVSGIQFQGPTYNFLRTSVALATGSLVYSI